MANYVSVIIDRDAMEEGKFYDMLVDKNGSTVLIEKMTVKKYVFENINYFETPEPYDEHSSYIIWKKIESNIGERYEDITSSVRVLKVKKDDKFYIAFESNQLLTGVIQFN